MPSVLLPGTFGAPIQVREIVQPRVDAVDVKDSTDKQRENLGGYTENHQAGRFAWQCGRGRDIRNRPQTLIQLHE